MGIEYYGIVFEDNSTAYVVALGKNIVVDDNLLKEATDALYSLLTGEGQELIEEIVSSQNILRFTTAYAMTRVSKLLSNALAVEKPRLLIYLIFAKFAGIEPKILSEDELYDGRYARVCVAAEYLGGWSCESVRSK